MPKLYYIGHGEALQVFAPNGKTSLSDPNDPDSYPVQHGQYVTLAAADTSTEELAAYKIPLAEVQASGLWGADPPVGHKDHPATPPPDPAKPAKPPIRQPIGGIVAGTPVPPEPEPKAPPAPEAKPAPSPAPPAPSPVAQKPAPESESQP